MAVQRQYPPLAAAVLPMHVGTHCTAALHADCVRQTTANPSTRCRCDRANAVQAQQHAFNTPLQLGPRMEDGSQFDQPEDADKYKLQLEAGDVLILATDGILDNM